jgi:alkylated DNA repair dioxygenase AlkB
LQPQRRQQQQLAASLVPHQLQQVLLAMQQQLPWKLRKLRPSRMQRQQQRRLHRVEAWVALVASRGLRPLHLLSSRRLW